MTPYYSDDTLTLLHGKAQDVLPTLDVGSIDCVVTSPPYFGLRDYEGNPDQIGLEETPAAYVARLVEVFGEVRRVLADDGTLWLNLGDTYSTSQKGSGGTGRSTLGLESGMSEAAVLRSQQRQQMSTRYPRLDRPEKSLLGIPWRVAFAMQDAGWILRNAVVWHKPNAMPESVRDRLSSRYELLFLLTKSRRYWFNLDAIRERHAATSMSRQEASRRRPSTPGKAAQAPGQTKQGGFASGRRELNEAGANPGDVWAINTRSLPEAHFAAFPVELPRRCILAGCKPGGVVLDPFSGAGTTALAAQQLGRRAIGIDINASYHDIALRRMSDAPLPFEAVAE